MPSLKQDVILQIEGNRKAFLKLEMGMTRGGLPASGNGSAQEQELRRLRTRTTQQRDSPWRRGNPEPSFVYHFSGWS